MTTCDIEILYFPFDMQACQIVIGTNIYIIIITLFCQQIRIQHLTTQLKYNWRVARKT